MLLYKSTGNFSTDPTVIKIYPYVLSTSTVQSTQNDYYPVQNISVNQCLFSITYVTHCLIQSTILVWHSNILHRAGKAAIDVDNYEYASMECYIQSMMSVLLHADYASLVTLFSIPKKSKLKQSLMYEGYCFSKSSLRALFAGPKVTSNSLGST